MTGGIVRALAFTPDGARLVSAGDFGELYIWDFSTGRMQEPVPSRKRVQSVAVSPDGRLLAVGCSYPFAFASGAHPPAPAYVIGLPDGRVEHALAGHRVYVFAASFRPDGKRLATLGAEGTIRVWDTGSGKELLRFETRPGSLGLAYSPDGQWLVEFGA